MCAKEVVWHSRFGEIYDSGSKFEDKRVQLGPSTWTAVVKRCVFRANIVPLLFAMSSLTVFVFCFVFGKLAFQTHGQLVGQSGFRLCCEGHPGRLQQFCSLLSKQRPLQKLTHWSPSWQPLSVLLVTLQT